MKNPIELVAFWGNDDVESRIKISLKQWNSILNGEEYSRSTWSYYEGERYNVYWSIKNRMVDIYGEDGAHWVAEVGLNDIYVYDLRTNEIIEI